MILVPWWDIDAAVAEVKRGAAMGMKGVVTCSNPQDAGLPDLATDHWNPFWETCIELGLPVNFHIGSSQSLMDWFGRTPWPSISGEQKLSIGSATIFLRHMQGIGHPIFGGLAQRYPQGRVLSGQSGVGVNP